MPVLAALGATLCYALTASYLKKHLSHVKPFAIAAGSQIATAIVLLIPSIVFIPTTNPSMTAWLSAMTLAILCTGFAYVMYFDLIAKIGASKAITVGYLVPLFGIFWGVLVLDETLTKQQIIGGVLIMIGVLLATNALKILRSIRRQPQS